MPAFREYVVGTDGRFKDFIYLNCSDEDEAKRFTRSLAAGRVVELWQEGRLIERFTSQSDSDEVHPLGKLMQLRDGVGNSRC